VGGSVCSPGHAAIFEKEIQHVEGFVGGVWRIRLRRILAQTVTVLTNCTGFGVEPVDWNSTALNDNTDIRCGNPVSGHQDVEQKELFSVSLECGLYTKPGKVPAELRIPPRRQASGSVSGRWQ
jgi:hypothetical protein